jgi:cephalosporin-C deacetylase-like acetyl esterase
MATRFSLQQSAGFLGLDRDTPYRDALLDFIEGQFHRLAAQLPRPATTAEWRQRAAELRAPLLHSLGAAWFPREAPLHVHNAGRIERDAYVIEKLVYDAWPGLPISAHLYLPRQARIPAPAVLYALGHWMENGKLEPDVQRCCANLARLGFVTLVYDMIGQGERLHECPFDHGHLEVLLAGLCQEGLMVWESMRAVDVLQSRPEVDGQRIGMTGASGGGLNTFYTAAVDERIQVSVPVCYVSTFFGMVNAERDRNWEDGVDLCNQVPNVAAYAEMSDICGLLAPRPQCIITAVRDWSFPIAAVRQVYGETQHIYTLAGAAERLRLVEVDGPHGYDREMRQAAYGWFARWLQGAGDGGPIAEVECELVTPAGPGFCFAGGHSPPPGPAITALAQQLAAQAAASRRIEGGAAAWSQRRAGLLARAPAVLGPWPARPAMRGPWIDEGRGKRNRIYKRTVFDGLVGERLVFESEPGIDLPALFLAPAQWRTRLPVVVYVDEWGKSAGLANGMVEALLAEQIAVLAVDVRGVGELAASDFEAASNALMTNRPLFAQQLWDVLRTVDCLWSGGGVSGRIDNLRIGCLGRGLGGMLALYAAALDERIAAAGCWEAPVSYHALIVEKPAFAASAYLFDVLNHFDLPDLMAATAPRPLLVADPVDGERCSLPAHTVEELCAWPRQVYGQLAASAQWQVLAGAATPAALAGWFGEHL